VSDDGSFPKRWIGCRLGAQRQSRSDPRLHCGFRVGDQGGSEELFRELALAFFGKAEAFPVRSAPPGIPPPGRVPLSARLLCGPSGLFLPCHQGTHCGLFDEMSDGLRLRHIHGVAAFDLDDR
jgi:hypothetical protein